MCARRVVDQELSRDRILEEARGLFAEKGFDTLTMRSIAKALGYSHGALYYHFRDKAELFYALVVEDFNFLLMRQKQLLDRTEPGNVEHLREMMLEFIKFGMENPHHYEIMFMVRDNDLRKYSRTKQAQCMDLFASVVREVIRHDADVERKTYTLPWSLFMSLHGFISYSIHFYDTYQEIASLAEAHVQYLISGIHAELGSGMSGSGLLGAGGVGGAAGVSGAGSAGAEVAAAGEVDVGEGASAGEAGAGSVGRGAGATGEAGAGSVGRGAEATGEAGAGSVGRGAEATGEAGGGSVGRGAEATGEAGAGETGGPHPTAHPSYEAAHPLSATSPIASPSLTVNALSKGVSPPDALAI